MNKERPLPISAAEDENLSVAVEGHFHDGIETTEEELLPDQHLYERLIKDGVVAAMREGRAVDHVTARRLAILLASEPQEQPFVEGLVRFARTGAVSKDLKTHLRKHSRSDRYPDQPLAEKLMEYCISRGNQLGPIGEPFGAICDQLDQAEVMLAAAVQRSKQNVHSPQTAWPERDGLTTIAMAYRDPESQRVSLVLDAITANIAAFALAAHAADREAHAREVELVGEMLPEDSYGRINRRAIAAREARIARRLRAVERAYTTAIEEVVVLVPPRRGSARPVQNDQPEMRIESR
jgi:hypothetical protein